jgi:hypothetical protein
LRAHNNKLLSVRSGHQMEGNVGWLSRKWPDAVMRTRATDAASKRKATVAYGQRKPMECGRLMAQ